MKIPKDIESCVAFVGLQMADESYRVAGTVYFVSRDDNGSNIKYAVTAKHVVEGIKSKLLEFLFLRVNIKNGDYRWIKTPINDWQYHEDKNVDVATLKLGFYSDIDQMFFPLSAILTEEIRNSHQIGGGDEVFTIGLFKHHHGSNRNIPITRIGNISAMPKEKIQTRNHLMDGYLIEARSIGGLSGSPVFVNLGIHRDIDGEVKVSNGGIMYFLIGMIYGHYDTKISELDSMVEDVNSESDRVNTGIAIVTPINKLINHLNTVG